MRVGYFNYKDGKFTVSYDSGEKQDAAIMMEFEFNTSAPSILDVLIDEEEHDEYQFNLKVKIK